MLQYIKTLLPRLQHFSASLDHLEIFVDKPWVFIDEKERRHIYIFQRNNTLIMSLNGEVQLGKWEYIAPAASLLIDRNTDKILLNHGFIDKGVMILRKDGSFDQPWMLINENEVPDLDVERYLHRLYVKLYKLKTFSVNEKTYYYSDPDNLGINSQTEFYDENLKKVTVSFVLNGNHHYDVQDGVIKAHYYTNHFKTDKGIVTCVSRVANEISIGEQATINGLPAADGYYKLLNMNSAKGFTVGAGKVVAIKLKDNFAVGWLLLAVAAFVILLVIVESTDNNPKVLSNASSVDSSQIFSTDTNSSNNTLLLSDTASIYSPPLSSTPPESNTPDTAIEIPEAPDYFTMGSSIEDVLRVQGQPTSIMGTDFFKIFSYGLSSVTFTGGEVSGYSDNGNLKIRFSGQNNDNSNNYFSLGSTISEVLDAQGQPTSIMGSGLFKIYSYGLSSVTFNNGTVSGYSNQGNLRIR